MILIPGNDSTPFTPAQLDILEQAGPIIAPVYKAAENAGVQLLGPDKDGRYWFEIDGDCLMTTTNIDLLDHGPVLKKARGKLLSTGLGMGVAVLYGNANPAVTEITVVEKDQRVIDMMRPLLEPAVSKPFTIIHADADTFDPTGYDWVYLDHGYAQLNADVVARYRQIVPTVSYWFENREALEDAWQ